MLAKRPSQVGAQTWTLWLDQIFFVKDMQLLINDIQRLIPLGDRIVISITWEYQDPQHWLPKIQQIREKYPVSLILDRVYQLHEPNFRGIPVHYVDFFLLKTYYEIHVRCSSGTNDRWNDRADSFLLLSCKPNRLHRIGLVYRFYKLGLLDRACWSLFVPSELYDQCREVIPEISDQEFADFVGRCQGSSPDGVIPQMVNNGLYYGGFPYDHAMYSNTLFRVVSETSMSNPTPWITEKTYIPLANNHPFVVAGDNGTLSTLKSQGFETFESILPISDYDSIPDASQRLSAVVENTRYLLDNITDHEEYIRRGTQANVENFNIRAAQGKNGLEVFLQNQGAEKINIYRAISFPDAIDTWCDFYYNVKDESWPDCYNEDDFDKLPEHIQQECIEVFGYTRPH